MAIYYDVEVLFGSTPHLYVAGVMDWELSEILGNDLANEVIYYLTYTNERNPEFLNHYPDAYDPYFMWTVRVRQSDWI